VSAQAASEAANGSVVDIDIHFNYHNAIALSTASARQSSMPVCQCEPSTAETRALAQFCHTGSVPAQRGDPGRTTLHTACATCVGVASFMPGFGCLNTSQKNPPENCVCVCCVMVASRGTVRGSSARDAECNRALAQGEDRVQARGRTAAHGAWGSRRGRGTQASPFRSRRRRRLLPSYTCSCRTGPAGPQHDAGVGAGHCSLGVSHGPTCWSSEQTPGWGHSEFSSAALRSYVMALMPPLQGGGGEAR